MHQLRDRAILMRQQGASFNEINRELGIHKGTLSYMLKSFPLSEDQQKLRKENNIIRQQNFAKDHPEILKQRNKKAAQSRREKDPLGYLERMRSMGKKARHAANLTYRKDELSTKKILEEIYGVRFEKEKIGNRYIDFASSDLLIEYSIDATHGLSDLIKRLEDVQTDPRQKIAYINTQKIGPKWKTRLEKIAVIIDYRTIFNDENSPPY